MMTEPKRKLSRNSEMQNRLFSTQWLKDVLDLMRRMGLIE